MSHNTKKYEVPEQDSQMVSAPSSARLSTYGAQEPLEGVAYAVQQQDMRPQVVMELSNVHKFHSAHEMK